MIPLHELCRKGFIRRLWADGEGEVVSSANFAFLASHDGRLVALGTLAERCFGGDPATAIFKIRQPMDQE